MTHPSSELPEFSQPPITELVLGVQFPRLAGMNIAHMGRLTEVFRSTFPTLQEMPPLQPTFEVFGLPANPVPQFAIKPLSFTQVIGVRLWMISLDSTCLIQFQPDRLVLNWRKVRPSDQYPRYSEMKRRFLEVLNTLRKFLADERLPDIQPNQCEISYLNQIPISGDQDWWVHPEALTTVLRPIPKAELETIEDVKFQIRYVLKDWQKEPFARMIVSFEPCQASFMSPISISSSKSTSRRNP